MNKSFIDAMASITVMKNEMEALKHPTQQMRDALVTELVAQMTTIMNARVDKEVKKWTEKIINETKKSVESQKFHQSQHDPGHILPQQHMTATLFSPI